MTNQQGAPEALRLAGILDGSFSGQLTFYQVANELRRLAALVEAQQPAPLCTRSHPHEQMTWRCQVLSVVAELRNMEARGQEATEHELGRFADRLDVALQPAPSAAAVDECRRCVGTGRIDTGKGALGHEVYADCPDCQPSPTPQADSQPAPASWLTNPAPTPEREFAEWLNERRGFPVSAVFHEIMHKFAARAPADSVTAPAERDEFVKLLAECRSAFPIPAPGDPLEVHWKAAMADPAEVPGYLQEIAASRAQAADSVLEDAARYQLLRRGQHWSVIDGIGNDLRADALDAAVDAARKQGANHD